MATPENIKNLSAKSQAQWAATRATPANIEELLSRTRDEALAQFALLQSPSPRARELFNEIQAAETETAATHN